MEPDKEKVHKLLSRVRDILTEALSNNDEIKAIMREIESYGLKVNLNFIALVGGPSMQQQGAGSPFMLKGGMGFVPEEGEAELQFEITDTDQEFLKDIGIKFNDHPKKDKPPEASEEGEEEDPEPEE